MCAPGALSPRGMTLDAQRLATVLCMRNGKSGPEPGQGHVRQQHWCLLVHVHFLIHTKR